MADYVGEQIAALRDEDWGVREDAALALGQSGDPRGVRPLIDALRDSDRAVQTAATSALMAIGEPAIMDLGSCLRDPDLSVQEAAASILSSIADERVVEPLMSALLSEDWVVRMHASRAMARLACPQAIETLVLLLQDKVPAVRDEAMLALKAIGEHVMTPLLNTLKDKDWRVRLKTTETLGVLGSKTAVQPLMGIVKDDPDTAVRQDAIRALGKIGDQTATEYLLGLIEDPRLQIQAIEALGKIGDRRSVPTLLKLVIRLDPREFEGRVPTCDDEKYERDLALVEAAVRALARLKDDQAIPVLILALQSTLVRKEAAEALSVFGKAAIPPLVEQFKKEPDENIQYHLKETLTRLGWNPNRIRLS
ncbi:HEAT repeat domain-containing protein [Candidatus Nitronereus thalassa]|uniref:HEAT repeat domain-containing protein n=1 Tax=Candidatus Nitronereus thalassa TaxID=3020898 RepID=A0ABU3K8J7_9BACT|nr:HEAT repeat domain-containing protein [Candidatus Nitronereus thalassa]MDT7042724.1 HEAT repeat domain-containing protein [Candidatus Nitronereus thalassa]